MEGDTKLKQLPDEMFTLIRSTSHSFTPRLGRLSLPGRRVIDTPHYLGNTSRGVVPHITQDTFRRDTSISGVYVGLEDFLERDDPPLYNFCPPNGASPLRRFTALPDETLLVVGARRTPCVPSPAANSNTDTSVAVCTSVGFKALHAEDYAEGVKRLKADIVVALGDVPYGRALGNKRVEKATDRSIQWLQEHVASRASEGEGEGEGEGDKAKLFASLLPVTCAKQQYYIDCLTDQMDGKIAGLTVFDTASMEDLPEALVQWPRLGITMPASPHEVLRQVGMGLDLLVIPFIGAATDAGIALDFSFPLASQPAPNGFAPLQLGIDMWSTSHASDLSPLLKDCRCYACTNHHRAYLQHLLMAKEMLGWVLLQVHNHQVMDLFFEDIRRSIASDSFEADVRMFQKTYESELPAKTGQGPRVRGYQFKSEGPGEPKKNAAPFTTLDDGKEKLAEAPLPNVDASADGLQDQGFAEKARGQDTIQDQQ